jgi:hypothetical protein
VKQLRASSEQFLRVTEEKLSLSKNHLVFDFLEVGVGFFWKVAMSPSFVKRLHSGHVTCFLALVMMSLG